ncbi:allergen Api m 6-like [Ctenocephalides felis]|uniref:allergen Api m 6-like n=1 Tax=Ctenocephalides felis TaxID=7515 RepID=UPI000E6E1DF7|nr:allergen Api m 6-like [Ctenocephalides felis]
MFFRTLCFLMCIVIALGYGHVVTKQNAVPGSYYCPDNEVFTGCRPCDSSCDVPNRVCTDVCYPGYFCKCIDGYVRNYDGQCVPWEYCCIVKCYNGWP